MSEWDKGFDAGMAGEIHTAGYVWRDVGHNCMAIVPDPFSMGYEAALGYRRAIRNRPAEPRDTEIKDLEEYLDEGV